MFALSPTPTPAPTTISNRKCLISPLISELELYNVLLIYSKVGSSFLLMALVLLYDLLIRSNRSFKIKNAIYLPTYHSQSIAMYYRHIAKQGLAFHWLDWFCSMTFQSCQKGHSKSKMLNMFLHIIARALQCITDIQQSRAQLYTDGIGFAL